MNYIVLGANFGDEGKGSVISNLIKQHDIEYVIRFNGGHQVGHTVNHNGIRHVFSNFGSGSLQGIPTYWSKYCTVHPLGLLNEYDILLEKGIAPILYIDPLCPVVTPFDIRHNRVQAINGHGSVGVGFGATIERNETPYKLYAQDLIYEKVLDFKLHAISNYYSDKGYISNIQEEIDKFKTQVKELLNLAHVCIYKPSFSEYDKSYIFEGGQGILLDQRFGFFPYVTRSNTTSQNAIELIKEFGHNETEVIYVSRSYLTRHGNGPLPFESREIKYEDKTNIYNEWQGHLRFAPLNIDLLKYSIQCDSNFHNYNKKLYLTCIDQTGVIFDCIINNELKTIDANELTKLLSIKCIFKYKVKIGKFEKSKTY